MNRKRCFLFLTAFILPVYIHAIKTVEVKSPEAAVAYALKNNKSLVLSRQIASCEVNIAKRNVGDLFPKLSISFNDGVIVNPDSNDYKNKSLDLGFSWLVYDGGLKKSEYELNVFESLFNKCRAEENVKSFCLQILETYYDFQKELRNKEILEQTLSNAEKWKVALETEYSLGMILETDFMEYEVKCLEVKRKLITVEDKLSCLLFQLKKLLGMGVLENLSLPFYEKLNCISSTSSEDFKSLYRRALNNSTEYKRLVIEIEYSEKLRKIENSCFLPKISLQPGLSFQGEDYPLHGPKCQMMVSISFDRNPFFSVQGSQTISEDNGIVMGATSLGQGTIKNELNRSAKNQMNKLKYCNQIVALSDFEDNLRMELQKILLERKQLDSAINILIKDVEINEKIKSIIQREVQAGVKKTFDLLEQQVLLDEKKSLLFENECKLLILDENLEILCGNK